MDIRYFIGVDVSKARLDWAVYDGKAIVLQSQSENSEAGIKACLTLIKELPGFKASQSVCCAEHTAAAAAGIYNAHLLTDLHKLSFPLCRAAGRLESSRFGGPIADQESGRAPCGVVCNEVKPTLLMPSRSAGAASLNMPAVAYHFRFRDRIQLWQPPRPVMQKLTALSALRQRLIGVKQQLQQPLTEQVGFTDKALQKQLIKNSQTSLKALQTDLDQVEKQIDKLIQEDTRLKELFGWITSVPGVGRAIATEVLIATDEFKAITDPKKLACHAGVAPFEYKSGSSVRGKTRVSQHARLRLKSVFHLGAMSAIQMQGEIQDYYKRKLAEGKNKMLVLNAVRNKLIHRICSVVHREQKYDKNYVSPLA